jgi:nucleotide-binding universal stress UspA family protein
VPEKRVQTARSMSRLARRRAELARLRFCPAQSPDASARYCCGGVASGESQRASLATILADTPISTAIMEQIKRGRQDLVVIGSRRRGAVRAALLGTVSQDDHRQILAVIAYRDSR